MHGITLNFVSLAALAAALPHLMQTPGLISESVQGIVPGNAANATTASPAATSQPAATATNASESSPLNFAALQPSAPSYTFDQVKAALTAYNAKDGAAFAAAMQKFGFTSFDAIAAVPGSWVQLMQYIGADTPTAEAPTFAKVKSVLELWAKTNGASFQQAMVAAGLTSLPAVEAAPGKWAELLAAAKAAGVS